MRLCFQSLALTAIVSLAQPALGQDLHQQWAYCNNSDGRFPVDVVIRGCTAIIESAGAQQRSLTIAYTSRGNAYLRAGVSDKAISDFNRAIEINARITVAKHQIADDARPGADEAMIDLKRSILLNPQQIASYYLKRSRELERSGPTQRQAERADAKESRARH